MSQIDSDTLMLKAIRMSGLNDYTKIVNDGLLFEYIASYADDNEFLLNFLALINVLYSCREQLKEDELAVLEQYENMINNLKQKCSNNELDNTERIIYLFLLTHSLINNYKVDYSDISCYIKNVYNKGNIYYVPEEVFLIFASTLDHLNKEYNNDVSLVFNEKSDKICCYRYYEGRREIVVGGFFINIIKYLANKKGSRYYTIMYYVAFAVMHEFYHSIQFPKGIQNISGIKNPIYRKEAIVALLKSDFYNDFHNNFIFEQDANEYAFANINSILLELMDIKKIKKGKFRVICFKRISEGGLRLRQKEFAKRLNQEYASLGGNPEKQLKRSETNGRN